MAEGAMMRAPEAQAPRSVAQAPGSPAAGGARVPGARRGRRWGLGWAAMLLALGGGGFLTGCTSPEPEAFPEPPQPVVRLAPFPVTLTASVPTDQAGWTGDQRARIATFLDAYRDAGRGPLTVIVSGVSPARKQSLAGAIRVLAQRRGVAAPSVVVSAVSGDPSVTFRYTDYVAIPPTCRPERMLSWNPNGALSPNYGCAFKSDLAAIVASPADLLAPPAATPNEGAWGSRVVGAYALGHAPGAAHNVDVDIVGTGH